MSLRTFGIGLAQICGLMFLIFFVSGAIISTSHTNVAKYSINKNVDPPERKLVYSNDIVDVKIHWAIALPIGIGLSAGITCIIVSARRPRWCRVADYAE
jgi:hypothetical protein